MCMVKPCIFWQSTCISVLFVRVLVYNVCITRMSYQYFSGTYPVKTTHPLADHVCVCLYTLVCLCVTVQCFVKCSPFVATRHVKISHLHALVKYHLFQRYILCLADLPCNCSIKYILNKGHLSIKDTCFHPTVIYIPETRTRLYKGWFYCSGSIIERFHALYTFGVMDIFV